MPNYVVRELTEQNLVTWYLLPLIKLNKASFGESNFLDSFINAKGDILTVHLISTLMLPGDSHSFLDHKAYLDHVDNDNDAYMWFFLPSSFRADFEAFKAGKFSKFSEKAKGLIRQYAGLAYNVVNECGVEESDNRILALDKSADLREWWEKELGLEPLSPDLELLPIPKARNYREHPNAV